VPVRVIREHAEAAATRPFRPHGRSFVEAAERLVVEATAALCLSGQHVFTSCVLVLRQEAHCYEGGTQIGVHFRLTRLEPGMSS